YPIRMPKFQNLNDYIRPTTLALNALYGRQVKPALRNTTSPCATVGRPVLLSEVSCPRAVRACGSAKLDLRHEHLPEAMLPRGSGGFFRTLVPLRDWAYSQVTGSRCWASAAGATTYAIFTRNEHLHRWCESFGAGANWAALMRFVWNRV